MKFRGLNNMEEMSLHGTMFSWELITGDMIPDIQNVIRYVRMVL